MAQALDGKLHTAECPGCGRVIEWRAPVFDWRPARGDPTSRSVVWLHAQRDVPTPWRLARSSRSRHSSWRAAIR